MIRSRPVNLVDFQEIRNAMMRVHKLTKQECFNLILRESDMEPGDSIEVTVSRSESFLMDRSVIISENVDVPDASRDEILSDLVNRGEMLAGDYLIKYYG